MSLTREFFDTVIIVIIITGAAFAAVRVYRDFTRPLPGDPRYRPLYQPEDDTK